MSPYNTIISVKDIEGCKIVKMTKSHAIFSPILQFFNVTFKGLIRDCPYPPVWMKFDNVTFNGEKNPGIQMMRNTFRLPSGNYKIVIDIKTATDPCVSHVEIYYMIHFRNQTLEMDERF